VRARKRHRLKQSTESTCCGAGHKGEKGVFEQSGWHLFIRKDRNKVESINKVMRKSSQPEKDSPFALAENSAGMGLLIRR